MNKSMKNICIKSSANSGKSFLWKLPKIKTKSLRDSLLLLSTIKKTLRELKMQLITKCFWSTELGWHLKRILKNYKMRPTSLLKMWPTTLESRISINSSVSLDRSSVPNSTFPSSSPSPMGTSNSKAKKVCKTV